MYTFMYIFQLTDSSNFLLSCFYWSNQQCNVSQLHFRLYLKKQNNNYLILIYPDFCLYNQVSLQGPIDLISVCSKY